MAAKYFLKYFLALFILILQLKKAKNVSPISFSPTLGCKGYAELHQLQALQKHTTENSKQIFPEKELHILIPNFHTHSCVCKRFKYSQDRSAYSAAGKYVD
jgi:hypothetical protein